LALKASLSFRIYARLLLGEVILEKHGVGRCGECLKQISGSERLADSVAWGRFSLGPRNLAMGSLFERPSEWTFGMKRPRERAGAFLEGVARYTSIAVLYYPGLAPTEGLIARTPLQFSAFSCNSKAKALGSVIAGDAESTSESN